MTDAATITRSAAAADPLDRFWGDDLATADPIVADAIRDELDRQRNLSHFFCGWTLYFSPQDFIY